MSSNSQNLSSNDVSSSTPEVQQELPQNSVSDSTPSESVTELSNSPEKCTTIPTKNESELSPTANAKEDTIHNPSSPPISSPISSQPQPAPENSFRRLPPLKKSLSPVPLSQLKLDEINDCFVQLVSRERRTTKTGKPFYKVHFRDSQTTSSSTIWSDSPLFFECENRWQDGAFYKIRARFINTKFGLSLSIEQIRNVTPADEQDGFSRNKCMPSSDNSPESILGELLAIANEYLINTPLLPLIQKIFKDNRVPLCQAAASRNHHRSYPGGLLEHTLSVTKIVIFLCEHFSAINPLVVQVLNKPLVIAGALLHDIGKLSDSVTLVSGPQHTLAGDLIGHEILGAQIVEQYACNLNLDNDLKTLLQHLILSHSRFPDWKSPCQPKSLEAYILHYADYSDSTFISSLNILTSDNGNGGLTQRKGPLGEPLLKPIQPLPSIR